MVDLKKLFGLDRGTENNNAMVAGIIKEMNERHPYDRLHLIKHLKGRLDDPKHKICTYLMDLSITKLMELCSAEEIQLLIEEITPSKEDMELAGFIGNLEALLQQILNPNPDKKDLH